MWLVRRGIARQLCSEKSTRARRILSPSRALGLSFPFCKMELLIPALPQGDSVGATGATGWERPLETSLPVRMRQQPAGFRITSPHCAQEWQPHRTRFSRSGAWRY